MNLEFIRRTVAFKLKEHQKHFESMQKVFSDNGLNILSSNVKEFLDVALMLTNCEALILLAMEIFNLEELNLELSKKGITHEKLVAMFKEFESKHRETAMNTQVHKSGLLHSFVLLKRKASSNMLLFLYEISDKRIC